MLFANLYIDSTGLIKTLHPTTQPSTDGSLTPYAGYWDPLPHRILRVRALLPCREGRCLVNHVLTAIEDYILHLSQLRPGDGTIPLLDAYAAFCKGYIDTQHGAPLPKLLICHHGPSKSPENSLTYDHLLAHIDTNMKDLADRVCIVQVGPQDQMWNTLLTEARVLVQLSMVHGIPEVLLWALQKGKPVITTKEARFFSFLSNMPNVFLVDSGDVNAVSPHLFHLFTDNDLYARAVSNAPQRLPDGLTTVGNAAAWMFLVSRLSRVGTFEPNGEDIERLARQEAGPYT